MGLNRDLKLLSLSLFLWALGEGLFIFILPIYMTELGATPEQIGQIISVGAVAMAVSLLPAGWAADRFGPKSGLVSGWVFGIFSGLFFALSHDIPVFLIGWILYRVTAWVLPAISSYTTNARGSLTPERALSSVYSMFHAGLIVSPTIGGYIGKYFGLRTNFYIATIMFCISTLVILFLKHQPPHPVEQRAQPKELLTNRHFRGFMILVFITMVAVYLAYDFAPKFLREVKEIDLEQIGWLGTLNAIGGFTLNQYLGRRPPRRGMVLAIGLSALQVFIMLQASWIGWFALAYYLRGGVNAVRSLISALVTRIVKPSQWGLAFGLSETVSTAGDIVAPLLAGELYALAPNLPFTVALILNPIVAALVWFFAPRHEAQPTAPPVPISAD
jgi:predicted MFS family arabinose efflux permease